MKDVTEAFVEALCKDECSKLLENVKEELPKDYDWKLFTQYLRCVVLKEFNSTEMCIPAVKNILNQCIDWDKASDVIVNKSNIKLT